MGSLSGQVRVSSLKKDFVELIKKKEVSTDDSFLKIHYNFILGRYCLVGNIMRCYSIYTDELFEEIIFNSQI